MKKTNFLRPYYFIFLLLTFNLLPAPCLYAKIHLGIISAVKNKVKQLKEKKPLVHYDEKTNTVTIPNSTIITGGQQYSETATIPDT
ncbi:MAG: hypothetical protein AB1349_14045 [Elusimicrobiota bacterium]